MEKIFVTNSFEETNNLGYKLGLLLNGGDVVLLDGDLSAGKTTLTKGIGLGLDVKKIINSPTFTIVKEYNGRVKLYHLDLYRLDSIGEDFDLEEYFNQDSVCVVEWPFQVEELLPKEFLKININRIDDNIREFKFISNSERNDRIVGDLNV